MRRSFAKLSWPRQSEPSIIGMLDTAFASAIAEASFVADVPARRQQTRFIESIRRRAIELLALLDYDEQGVPHPGPRHPIAQTTPLMPWFQYLARGIRPARLATPAAGDFWPLVQQARHLVPAEAIRANHEQSRELHDITGIEHDGEDARLALHFWTIKQALETVPEFLAFLAAIAERARQEPLTKPGKSNFERAFRDELFVRLAHAYHEMFGTAPRGWLPGEDGTFEEKEPGPAARWARRILALAIERDLAGAHANALFDPGDVRVARIGSAIRTTAALDESTFSNRIERGWTEWKRRNDWT